MISKRLIKTRSCNEILESAYFEHEARRRSEERSFDGK